ncbi:MAG: DUF599 family protein [Bauldia sp.]|nr:DUF599 family protein [Bauldia sp.]
MTLGAIPLADLVGVIGFCLAWAGYSLLIDRGPLSKRTLSSAMDRQRLRWVRLVQARENRISDTNILGGLQQGAAFFASASTLVIGGCLAVLGSRDTVVTVIEDITPVSTGSSELFEMKIVGLLIIFVYAFFKFTWSYRLYNYASILVGALPPPRDAGLPATELAIDRCVVFLRLGGRNFNRGQRAFLFAIAFLGWLGGPLVLLGGSVFVLAVFLHRQFLSLPARAARIAPNEEAIPAATSQEAR